MFLYIYVDYSALYKPALIDNLRAGVVFEFDISPTLLSKGPGPLARHAGRSSN